MNNIVVISPHPDDETLIYSDAMPGDTAFIIVEKPFLTEDIYEFVTISPYIDTFKAKEDLKKIKVELVFPNFLISIIFSLVRIYDDGIVMLLMENYLIANFITQSLTRRCSTLLTDQNIEILDVSTTFR